MWPSNICVSQIRVVWELSTVTGKVCVSPHHLSLAQVSSYIQLLWLCFSGLLMG